ncbi:MAG: hypothetical protein RM338_01825 [Nostoc sp. DedQUE12a]|nr:hypothetical protein [Nostoc sp. DedQUE12a]
MRTWIDRGRSRLAGADRFLYNTNAAFASSAVGVDAIADFNRADWIVLLEQGKVKMQGTPEQLRSQSGTHLDFLTP